MFAALVRLFLVVGCAARYQACFPGRWGPECAGECACEHHEDCHAGPSGDGSCTCAYGQEALCGIPPRLLPAVEADAAGGDATTAYHSPRRLRFNNSALRALRVDGVFRRAVRQVENATLSHVLPMTFGARYQHQVVGFSERTARLLGMRHDLSDPSPPPAEDAGGGSLRADVAAMFSGQSLIPGAEYYAHAYGGHQVRRARHRAGPSAPLPCTGGLGPPPPQHHSTTAP
jgi:hypothetical protein